MKKSQWIVFGIGLIVFSSYMFWNSNLLGFCNALVLNDEQMTACFIRRYSYSIPAIISGFLGVICLISGWLENKK